MIDLACLVADKSIEAAIEALLRRPSALGIPAVTFETAVHPRRDPGCFHEAAEFLAGYKNRSKHALVVLDRDWKGAPSASSERLEELVESSLARTGEDGWANVVVIDPELEAWVFSDSPHVTSVLGWRNTFDDLRTTLANEGLWGAADPKPRDPKAAMDWILRRTRRPRSSAIFRELASVVGVARCGDRAFLRFVRLLRGWFGEPAR